MFKLELLGAVVLVLGLVNVAGSKYGFIRTPVSEHHTQVTVTADEDRIPDDYLAKAFYKNEIHKNGWAFLEVSTRAGRPDEQQARAAGFLEGYLTRDLIWMHWVNLYKGFCSSKPEICTLVESYLDRNEHFVLSTAKMRIKDSYWYQVLLLYQQLQGLAQGYNAATTDQDQHLTFRDIFWLNIIGDLDELSYSLWLRFNHTGKRGADRVDDPMDHFMDHCTGLVKLVPDLSELFTSQVTWNSYNSMLRVQKMYELNFRESYSSLQRIAGYKMSLSSYPGLLHSLDDFYIISSGLVPAETTIGNSRRTLYDHVKPEGQILEFVRAMVANRLSRDGREWVNTFSKHNSGTYNNQWYIVDYNKFVASSRGQRGHVSPGLLWVLEQLPGTTESADVTNELVKLTYFASYNLPYFSRIFTLGGGPERVRAYGDWFGQYTHPRAIMLVRLQADVRSLQDMLHVMRYNDYKHDPLARCADCTPPYSACNAVAARNDLNPANGTYPFPALGHRNHGATDAKITSSQLRASYQFVAQSGPPHNASLGIPPFSWSAFDLGVNISHLGHPDTWVFPALRHRWRWA